MRDVFIGVCYKVEVVGVWGCVGCLVGLCMCVSFGCVVLWVCCFGGVFVVWFLILSFKFSRVV